MPSTSPPRSVLGLALAAALLASACAGVDPALERLADGPYRVPGRAADPMPVSAEEGVLRYTLPLAGGAVQYGCEVAMARGEVRVRTVVRNSSRGAVRYRPAALALFDRAGAPLAPVLRGGGPAGAARPPDGSEPRPPESGEVRPIAPGEELVLVRRFLPGPPEVSPSARALSRLTLADEVEAGGRAEPIRLELARAQ